MRLSVLKSQGEVPTFAFMQSQYKDLQVTQGTKKDRRKGTEAKKRMKERVRAAAEKSAASAPQKSPQTKASQGSTIGQSGRYEPGMSPQEAKRAIAAMVKRNDAIAEEEAAWTFSVAGESPTFWKKLSVAAETVGKRVGDLLEQTDDDSTAQPVKTGTRKSERADRQEDETWRRRIDAQNEGTGM